jgi:hypothetical protein
MAEEARLSPADDRPSKEFTEQAIDFSSETRRVIDGLDELRNPKLETVVSKKTRHNRECGGFQFLGKQVLQQHHIIAMMVLIRKPVLRA